jgi:EAL domain-containing protein (putative c-di-GMP-specific phosphodiesterase class I)
MPLIDRWVIKNFCACYAQNNKGISEILSFYNINLSGASLDDDTFLPFVKEQLRLYAIPPEIVCFEITEHIAVASFHQAVRFMQETRYLGCSFAIDDFGKGISSFNYLKHLPVDYLKIDGGFVRNMTESPLDEFIVETINRLGHFLGMKTIAESVENEAVFNRLKELGVDYAQGYWIANPRRLQIFLPQAGL